MKTKKQQILNKLASSYFIPKGFFKQNIKKKQNLKILEQTQLARQP